MDKLDWQKWIMEIASRFKNVFFLAGFIRPFLSATLLYTLNAQISHHTQILTVDFGEAVCQINYLGNCPFNNELQLTINNV